MISHCHSLFAVSHTRGKKYKPASSNDWAYCAFNEQLQRIAGQLTAMIEGFDVGALVGTMVHMMLQVSSKAMSTRFLISSPRRVLPPLT
jgi:hypothetical protein